MSSTAVSDKENLPPAGAKRKETKRITPGQRVSGSVGEKVPNPDPKQRRQHRKRVYGNVLEECGPKKYKVQFDDGKIRECAANILRIERSSAFLPPGERPPPPSIEKAGNNNPDPDEEEKEDELGDPFKEGDEEWEAPPMEEDEQEKPGKNADAPTAKDPVTGGVWVGEDVGPNYHERLQQAREKIAGMLGQTVRKDEWDWAVIPEHHVDDHADPKHMGVNGIDLSQHEPQVRFAALFLHLSFRDWKESLQKLNCKLSQLNEEATANQRVALFQHHEFITALALMVAAACYSEQGKFLWLIVFFIFIFSNLPF
jgi:hypothetical protein